MVTERKALSAVEGVEKQIQALESVRAKRTEELLVEHLQNREPLLKRRHELVTGKSDPSAEELEGFVAAGPGSSVSSTTKSTKGLPFFWLNVLCNHDQLSEHITPRDRCALEYLEDVAFVRGKMGMVVEFHFATNPFFTNKVLKRGVFVKVNQRARNPLDAVEAVREEATDVDWRPGKSLLVKEVAARKVKKNKKAAKAAAKAAGKKGGKKGSSAAPELADPLLDDDEDADAPAAAPGRSVPCPSFFRFFLPLARHKMEQSELDPTAVEDDDEEEDEEEQEEDGEAAEKQMVDHEILDIIMKVVIPRAVHLYLAGPLQGPSEGLETEAEEDDGFELVSGSPAGDVGSLPLPAQRCLHALKKLQDQMDALSLDMTRGEWEAAQAQHVAATKLAAQRRQLLVSGDQLLVPAFWLRALKALDSCLAAIQARDEHALSFLSDVRMDWDWKDMPTRDQPTRSGTLELEFLPNPYFANPVLRKRYTFSCAGGSMYRLSLHSSQPDAVEWHEGKDLTVRTVAGRTRAAASFFCLFKKGALRHAFNIPGEDRRAAAEALAAEEAMLAEVIGPLLNAAGSAAAAVDVDLEEIEAAARDEREEEEEEEEEEGEGDGEEEEGPNNKAAKAVGRRAVRRLAKPQSSGVRGALAQLANNRMLAVLVVLIAIGQVLLFLDIYPRVHKAVFDKF